MRLNQEEIDCFNNDPYPTESMFYEHDSILEPGSSNDNSKVDSSVDKD